MSNQFYPQLMKGFVVLNLLCLLYFSVAAQTSPPMAAIINNTGTTQINCAVPAISVTAIGGNHYSWSAGLGNDANASITTAGTYTVTVSDDDGRSADATISITENPTGLPASAGIDGPINVCNYVGTRDVIQYTAMPVAGASSYEWVVPPTVEIISGQGTNVLSIKINPAFTSSPNKQLRVKAMAACGAGEVAIKYLAVQVPGSVPQISGPTDVCPYLDNGLEAVYSIPDIPGAASYQWAVPGGMTITHYDYTNIHVTFNNNFVTGNITVFAMNSCGVSNTRSITVKRMVPAKPGIIFGAANACMFMPSAAYPSGVTATYSVTRSIGTSYNWTVPDGVTIVSHSNTATKDYIDVNFSALYAGGDISVTASNGCGTSAGQTFKMIRINPGATSPISSEGQVQVCPDRQYQYSVTAMPASATSVLWTVPSGSSIVSGQGTTSIIVAYPPTVFSGIITASGNNGCAGSVARSINVHMGYCSPERNAVTGARPVMNVKAALTNSSGQMQLEVFPNPSSADFKVKVLTAGQELVYVKIMDVQGRVVRSMQVKPNEAIGPGVQLKAGIYMVEARQSGQVSTTRLIRF